MAQKKYVTLEGLEHLKEKTDELYVKRELKTDSEDEYKVLSDNNLTDELKTKIENAGDSSFDGNYKSLTNKPKIDGNELSADSTADSLGLAKKDDLPVVATTMKAGIVKPDGVTITVEDEGVIKAVQQDLSTYAQKSELPKQATTLQEGTVKPDGTTITVEGGVISATAPDLSGYVEDTDIEDMLTKTDAQDLYLSQEDAGNDYLKKEEASTEYLKQSEAQTKYLDKETAQSDYAAKTDLNDYAKSSQVTQDISDAKDEINESIKSQLSATYKFKGSKNTVQELPDPSSETVGDTYNMTNAFTTDDKFTDPSTYYPKGTNVAVSDVGGGEYKYDALSGVEDLSIYVKDSDLIAVTNEEIDSLFE